MDEEVELRPGGVDSGRIYEQRMAALLATKLSLAHDVDDFWMLSNVDGVGAFDDLVFRVQNKSGTKYLYCMQMKHRDKKPLQMIVLENEESDFSLKIYEKSFGLIMNQIDKRNIFTDIELDNLFVIFFTNANIAGKGRKLSAKRSEGPSFINTSTQSDSILRLSNRNVKEGFLDETFLSRFLVYSKQANAQRLEELIKKIIYSHFKDVHNASIFSLTHFFTRWSFGNKNKIKILDKKHVQLELLELMLSPYVVDPNALIAADDLKIDLIKNILLRFNIVNISKERLLKHVFCTIKKVIEEVCGIVIDISNSWNAHLTQQQLNTIFSSNGDPKKETMLAALRNRSQFQPHIPIKDLYIVAWRCRLVPLILNCPLSQNTIRDCFQKFEKVVPDLSFVLLKPDFQIEHQNLSTLVRLTDIDDVELLNRSLNSMTISLQGKTKISIHDFNNNPKIIKEITPDIFLTLLDETLLIGIENEIEEYYVKREIQLPKLKMEMIELRNVAKRNGSKREGELFIIVEPDNLFVMKHHKHIKDLDKFAEDIIGNIEQDNIYLLSADKLDIPKLKNEARSLKTSTQKSIHVVRFLDENTLEWIYSAGSVNTLQKFVLESLSKEFRDISEDDMFHNIESKLNILSNNAGMGKTMFLKSVANMYSPSTWVTYVNLIDHSSEISKIENMGQFMQYIFCHDINNHEKFLQKFLEKIYLNCIQNKQLVWLFDGYDEIASKEALVFLKATQISNLADIWITTRPTFKQSLEEAFDTLAIEICQLNENNRKLYIRNYFTAKEDFLDLDSSQIERIIQSIEICLKTLDTSFARIPLQTKMLAEVFADDYEHINDKQHMTIVELYDLFIDIKLREYKSYEANSLRRTVSKLALKLFYDPDQLEDLIEYDELLEDIPAFEESYKKDTIVTGIKKNGDAYFGHRTYAEFLAAQWIFKKIVNKNQKNKDKWLPLAKMLFYNEMQPVRVFFDRIVGQNSPLHVAVLNNDLDTVKMLVKNDVTQNNIDLLGRTALHIAASHGKFYDVVVPENIKGIKYVGLHSSITDLNQNHRLTVPRPDKCQVSMEILNKLLEETLLYSKDNIFGFDVFEYAMNSSSLQVLDQLYKKFDKKDLILGDCFNIKLLIFIIAYSNFHNILSSSKICNLDEVEATRNLRCELREIFIDNIKLFQLKYNDMYLTEVAAAQGSKEIIHILTSTGVLDISCGSPVHTASMNGHADTIEFLFKLGANIESWDEKGFPPIFQAGRQHRSDVTYNFLKNYRGKLTVNSQSSPIHYACQGGHSNVVRTLINLGASVNKKDSNGFTPLFYAVTFGHYDIISILLCTNNIDPEDIRRELDTACSNDYVECARVILRYIENINSDNKEGYTPLMIACENGSVNVVKLLISSADCIIDQLNAQETFDKVLKWAQANNHASLSVKMMTLGELRLNKGGLGAIHYAVMRGNAECVKILLETNANNHLCDEIPGFGYSPIVWSTMYGHDHIVALLMNYEPKQEELRLALSWAAALGYRRCLANLLCPRKDNVCDIEPSEKLKRFFQAEFGFDFGQIDLNIHNLALLAAKNNHLSIVKELVITNYSIQADLDNALRFAARNGYVDCVNGLLNLGADEYSTDNIQGLQIIPLAWSCMYNQLEVVKCLLKNKDKACLENDKVHYALNWAAMCGNLEMVKMLLEFGLNVDNVDHFGNTPLAFACEHRGTKEVVKELLSYECDMYMKNNEGQIALELAINRNEFNISKVLLMKSQREKLNVKNDSSLLASLQTYLKWARTNNDNDVIDKLYNLGIYDGK